MSILIKDLKGFDFSDKYLNIHEKFSIKKDGKQVDFKIIKSEYGDVDEYRIEYNYHAAGRLINRSQHYKNPFEIFREVEDDIIKSDNIFNQKSILIKNFLIEFNPNFDKWDELTKELTSKVDILKFHPNYKSSKVPQDLSKEELSEYFDKFSKYELESLFRNLSILDFEIFYQNTWGEDYEYLIEKAFSVNVFGEEVFNWTIFDIINQKRNEFYIEEILKNYGFEIEKDDMVVSIVYSIINSSFGHGNRFYNEKLLRLQRLSKRDKITLNEEYFQKMKKVNKIIENELNNYNEKHNQKIDFDNPNNLLSKLGYVKNLIKISSDSKAEHIMRYKIPNDHGDVYAFQTAALNHGHIQIGNSKDNLSQYLIVDLRNVLKKYGLKLDGNKTHLINRIKENLSDEIVNKEFPKRYYSLTEKGREYIEKYEYVTNANNLPANFTFDEFEEICDLNPSFKPVDIMNCLTEEKWIIWDKSLGNEPMA